jgi:hypothetical protein
LYAPPQTTTASHAIVKGSSGSDVRGSAERAGDEEDLNEDRRVPDHLDVVAASQLTTGMRCARSGAEDDADRERARDADARNLERLLQALPEVGQVIPDELPVEVRREH